MGVCGSRWPDRRALSLGDAELNDSGFHPCNIWQCESPDRSSRDDGHLGTAPADVFSPNGFGLFNMVGDALAWCADPFRIRSLARSAKHRNQSGRANNTRLLKGGCYLGHRSYCHRYGIAARTGAGSLTGHVGCHLVFDAA